MELLPEDVQGPTGKEGGCRNRHFVPGTGEREKFIFHAGLFELLCHHLGVLNRDEIVRFAMKEIDRRVLGGDERNRRDILHLGRIHGTGRCAGFVAEDLTVGGMPVLQGREQAPVCGAGKGQYQGHPGRLTPDGVIGRWLGEIVVQTDPEGQVRARRPPGDGKAGRIKVPLPGMRADELDGTNAVVSLGRMGCEGGEAVFNRDNVEESLLQAKLEETRDRVFAAGAPAAILTPPSRLSTSKG